MNIKIGVNTFKEDEEMKNFNGEIEMKYLNCKFFNFYHFTSSILE